MREHFRGALIGTFVGDALGAPVEGRTLTDIRVEHGRLTEMVAGRRGRGRYTDDTELMIALAEALIDGDGALELDAVAERFAHHFDPRRGYGGNAVKILQALRAGTPWARASAQHKPPGGSFGNGSAMRVAPIALACFPDRHRTVAAAARQGAVTGHTHPLGEFGAHVQAAAIHAALTFAADDEPWDGRSVFEALLADGPPREYERALRWMIAQEGYAAGPTVEMLGVGVRAHQSVLTSLWVFHAHATDPEAAVVEAVNLGGDADTIGAMTGAIAGAYHGMAAFPERWISRLERGPTGFDHCVALADDLWSLYAERLDRSGPGRD